MLWREVKELAGMAFLLGILVVTGSSVASAVGAAEIAEVRDVPAVEQPVEAEVLQALGSTDPVGSPDRG
jgi:hypothetical protein